MKIKVGYGYILGKTIYEISYIGMFAIAIVGFISYFFSLNNVGHRMVLFNVEYRTEFLISLIVMTVYLIVMSIFRYWPRLILDVLSFNKKKETFKLITFIKHPARECAVDPELIKKYNKIFATRQRDGKLIAFPASDTFGWENGDMAEIKYYRFSKIILSARVVQEREDAKTDEVQNDIRGE